MGKDGLSFVLSTPCGENRNNNAQTHHILFVGFDAPIGDVFWSLLASIDADNPVATGLSFVFFCNQTKALENENSPITCVDGSGIH